MAVGATTSGWRREAENGRLALYVAGTLVGVVTATNFGMRFVSPTTLTAVTTVTAGTGVIVTTGNYTQTASDHMVTAGNVRLGAVSTFGTTEPTSAYVMKVGTAAAGAITTSSGIMTDGVNIQKIIADGTVSAVET